MSQWHTIKHSLLDFFNLLARAQSPDGEVTLKSCPLRRLPNTFKVNHQIPSIKKGG